MSSDKKIIVPITITAIGASILLTKKKRKKTSRHAAVRFEPGSEEQISLFEKAADFIGAPREWASDPGLINILKNESDGRVGVPNYTYGERAEDESKWPEIWRELRKGIKTAKSSATGLGQLILDNVDTCYPDGRMGIGDALNEAAGMLCYIKMRYGNPANAWNSYGKKHEGY